ncbi:MAG: hypothetical protein CSA20_04900 [Deltaproteobacteria bacterium]|nr:MAG: hypothetical protein CSB32_00750 [Desulfobacterales bacterium]PIE73022.1 MAG: hypothetical protein CSA20_04900 [Deltaproteobacteria bacterium]
MKISFNVEVIPLPGYKNKPDSKDSVFFAALTSRSHNDFLTKDQWQRVLQNIVVRLSYRDQDNSMDDRLHIIVADERGKDIKFLCSRPKLQGIVFFSCIALLSLTTISVYSLFFLGREYISSTEIAELRQERDRALEEIAEQKRIHQEQQDALNLQIASLLEDNQTQAETFREEKKLLMANAVGELSNRAQLIEKVFASLGIKIPREEATEKASSGGPFVPYEERQTELLNRVDSYLQTLNHLPLGPPVPGSISSKYGKRIDPINHQKAFHTGLDFRGKRGQKVRATADGVVVMAQRYCNHGKYVKIRHGNGFYTSFSHLHSYNVRRGDKIQRGQVLGEIGNTGRSTGSHLHYEVSRNGKTINPIKFVKASRLLR